MENAIYVTPLKCGSGLLSVFPWVKATFPEQVLALTVSLLPNPSFCLFKVNNFSLWKCSWQ